MSILLSRLCENTEKTYGMKLLAGKNGTDSPVRWVHIIDDAEATNFIHGNELVFTTGIRQQGVDWLLGYVVSLRESGAVGLVVNIGPYITEIPPQVIVYCENNDLPLFTLPWAVHIIDVTYDFCHRIVSNEETETSIAAAFRNLIFSPENKDGYKAAMLRSGFHDESSYTIMAIACKCNGKSTKASDFWKKYHFNFSKILKKSQYPVCLLVQENNLIVIRQKSPPEEMVKISEMLKNQLAYDEHIFIGISTAADGWSNIPRLYNEAVSTMTVAKQKKRTCMLYSDIGLYKLLFGVRDVAILQDYSRTMLGALTDYDHKNSTDYTKTLRDYLENNSSVQIVAGLMNVHRNTVNYKIKMIKEILGTELKESDKLNYRLAFCVMDMLNAV